MEAMENMFLPMMKAMEQSLKELTECKDLAQKKTHAEIVKLLSESMGIFINAMKDDDIYEDFDDSDLAAYDEEKEAKPPKRKKNSKDDIPF
jgi:hypothetical protein